MSTTHAAPDAGLVAEGPDAGTPLHHGDPLAEQRLLTNGAGLLDRSHRAVLQVPGEDRLGWLHSICSQYLDNLADGESVEALVLSPHGHVEQHWQVTELGGVTWVDSEPGSGPDVLGYLNTMRFLKRVEPTDVTDAWAVLTLAGPRTGDVLAAAGLPTPEPGYATALPDGGFVRRLRRDDLVVVDVVVPRTSAEATSVQLRDAGAVPVGVWAFEALRVVARIPRLGFETDHRTIPHEVGWIGRAVHLDKGCYRGQETVARVHNLGRPPRRLVLLHLAGESDELPAAGTPVELAGRPVGFLGTAVHHHELGPVALAVIKRATPDDAELTVAGHAAAIDAG